MKLEAAKAAARLPRSQLRPTARMLQKAMVDLQPVPDAVLRGIMLGSAASLWVIVLVRLIGARTLSKVTAFDFVVTLATGSLLAAAASAGDAASFAQAIAAMTTLLLSQYLLAMARRRYGSFRRAIENEPLILLRDGRFDPSRAALARRQARVPGPRPGVDRA